jgi:hypothetical protein
MIMAKSGGRAMDMNWIRAIGASFDIAITVLFCAFVGYFICGGRLNEVTPLSIIGLAIGAFFGLIIAMYHITRMFGGGEG